MLADEIIHESPDDDLNALRQAQRAATAFSGWLTDNNDTKTLNDCGMMQGLTRNGDRLWYLPARRVGIDVVNVYVGIGWNPKGSANGGFATTMQVHGQKAILVVVRVNEDPGLSTDVAFSIRWNDFIHEWTHVADYQRGYLKHKAKQEKNAYQKQAPAKYYNSPIEFNAFYQQGLDKTLVKLARFASPDDSILKNQTSEDYIAMMQKHYREMTYEMFKKVYGREFNFDWLRNLNDDYKRRFAKRFFKLYKFVQADWPDIAAIRDRQAETADIEAKWATKDAA